MVKMELLFYYHWDYTMCKNKSNYIQDHNTDYKFMPIKIRKAYHYLYDCC